jgi:hypothetical protein
MLFTGCDEYRELMLQYDYAKRRLWRYTHPEEDPFMNAIGAIPSRDRIENARADELELAWRIHAHETSCEACRGQASSATLAS